MNSTHFVTGGTGFIGLCLILELLRQTNAEIVCLVRPGEQDIHTRLCQQLSKAAQAYQYDKEIIQSIEKRCRVISGDIRSELCNVPRNLKISAGQFWHCAASLNYEESQAANIFATNLDGTKNALALAKHIGATCFNYISTAYVAGTRTGIILEELMKDGDGQQNCNLYEKSKTQAEALVAQTKTMSTRIFRPSVVIGHSQTHAVVGSFTGVYGLIRRLRQQFKKVSGRLQEGTVRMVADPKAHVNFIPVDMVARQAVQCAHSSSTELVFHLTNATPPTVADILGAIYREMNMPEPHYVNSKEDLSSFDAQLHQKIDFFNPYLAGDKVFDRHHIDTALGQTDTGNFNLDKATLQAFFHWYHLEQLASRHSSQRVVSKV